MVASNARKERRRQMGDHTEVPKKKMKFGRKEKRTVTRHTRRNHGEEEAESQADAGAESEPAESEAEENSDDEGNGASFQTRKAYESLVTLLKHDHRDERKKDKTKAPADNTDGAEEEGDEEDEQDEEDEIVGMVESDEEGEDEEEDVQDESEDEAEGSTEVDPFNYHFNDETRIESEIKTVKASTEKKLKLKSKSQHSGFSFAEHVPAAFADQTSRVSNSAFDAESLNVKRKLVPHLQELTEAQTTLCQSMFRYQNVNLQYYEDQQLENTYQDLYLTHCLNHVFKTRDRILKNNYKKAGVAEKIAKGEMRAGEEPDFRDQGYTRPKVLILLPTRNFAYELVNKMIKIAAMDTVENKTKFKTQFYDKFAFGPESKKSTVFKEFFKGNTNDFFCLGLKFTRKSLKLYSSFETSDIIMASPIGLKMLLDKKSGGADKKSVKSDSLSSIEILVLDKSHGLVMQNWEHVSTIVKRMNQVPRDFNTTMDFSRIRMWSLDDNAKYLTQFLNFTRVATPELNNLIQSKSLNLAGCLTVKPVITEPNAMINKVARRLMLAGILNNETRLGAVFQRFDTVSPLEEPDARFKFFINVTLPHIMNKSSYKNGFLLYVPSYMDYLRLTNHFKQHSKIEVLNIDEYSSQSKLTKSRLLFEQRPEKYKIMLYTERLHFYKNYDIKGVKNLVFYALPTDPQFYQDCVNFLVKTKLKNDLIVNGVIPVPEGQEPENFDLNLCMIRVLYSKFDFIKLEKVVGLQKAAQLCNGANEMYDFR